MGTQGAPFYQSTHRPWIRRISTTKPRRCAEGGTHATNALRVVPPTDQAPCDGMSEPAESAFKIRPAFVLWFFAALGWLLIIAAFVLWWGLPRWVPDVVVEESPWLGPAFEAVLHKGNQSRFMDRLPEWGERVVPDMCTIAASNADTKRRVLALDVLQSKNDPRAMPTLIALLNDPEEEIVQQTLYGLWGIKDPAIVQPVLDLLLRSSPKIAQSAAELLVSRPQDVSFELISSTLLNASHDDHQALGCVVLQSGTDPRVIPALVERLGRFRRQNLDLAGYSLGKSLLPGATEAIATALADPDPRRRYGAVTAVRWPHPKADRSALLQPLLPLITDSEAEVQTLAIRALRNFPDDAALAALRSTVVAGGASASIAVESLILNRSPAAFLIVLNFIDHPEAEVRKKLLRNLRIFATIPKDTDHRIILTLLHHQDPEVVEVAKTLAGKLKLTPDERRELDAVK